MPKNIDIGLIRTFLTVVETNGMTSAAQLLNLTQGAVSQQIKRLESLLDKTLFERSNKVMHLTADGERLVPGAYRLLSLNDEIWHHMVQPEFLGEIKLGVPVDIVRTFMPTVLRQFTREYPKVRVTLFSDTTPALLEKLAHKEIDLTLTTESSPGNKQELLLSDRLIWIGADNGDAHTRNPLPVSLGSESCAFRQPAIERLNQAKMDWRPVCQIGSLESILASVEADMAIAAYLSQVIPRELKPIDDPNLPELPHFYINLRQPKSGVDLLTSKLTEHIRLAFRNWYYQSHDEDGHSLFA